MTMLQNPQSIYYYIYTALPKAATELTCAHKYRTRNPSTTLVTIIARRADKTKLGPLYALTGDTFIVSKALVGTLLTILRMCLDLG